MKTIVFLIILYSCTAEAQDKKVISYFHKYSATFNLEYYIFFERELIHCLSDTTYRKNFDTVLNQQFKKAKSTQTDIARERKIFLNVLYNRVEQTVVKNQKDIASQRYLLNKLAQFKKLDFVVNEEFIRSRLDLKKKGITFWRRRV